MARPLRLEFAGAVYHLTSRGNAGQPIFLEDADRRHFLSLLRREVHQQGWLCHAYCLMTNHFHLLVETPRPNLAWGMRRLNGSYVQRFNRRHDRTGHLFQRRYKGILVEKESHLLELCRYIVLNPVRAGMAAGALDWPWSSYAATAGLAHPPDWLQVDWLLGQFARTRRGAQEAYRRFVQEGLRAPAPWGLLRGQIWLGGSAFRERMLHQIGDDPLPEVTRAQTNPCRPTREEVLAAVCAIFRVERSRVLGREDQPAAQAAMFALRRGANLSLRDVAGLFGVSPSRVSQVQREIERDRPSGRLAHVLKRCNVRI